MTPRFAFLLLEEHPYGREMLRVLLARGFCPNLIVEEASSVADEERVKFLTRIAGEPVPQTVAEIVVGRGIARRTVENHNGAACRALLEEMGPELLVLGGTRILRPTVLAIPPLGTINAHPGLLPRLRGSSSVAWALYKDLPVGATTHFVEAGIDTGPILLRQRLDVHRGDTYEKTVRCVIGLSAELMADTLALFEEGKPEAIPQELSEGETLRVIPGDLLAQARARLAGKRYSHFED